MAEVLWGVVEGALDGETVEVRITDPGAETVGGNGHRERVQILYLDVPEPIYPPEFSPRLRLQRRLGGKAIRMDVLSRDPDGRLVCGVSLANRMG
jgi:endonuclease YncB( thermonuclease family)